jgi:hypothetical protein
VGASISLVLERDELVAGRATTLVFTHREFIRATTNQKPGPQGPGFFSFAFQAVILSGASAFACERWCEVEGSLPAELTPPSGSPLFVL